MGMGHTLLLLAGIGLGLGLTGCLLLGHSVIIVSMCANELLVSRTYDGQSIDTVGGRTEKMREGLLLVS